MEQQTVNQIQTGEGLAVVRVENARSQRWDDETKRYGAVETYTVKSEEHTDRYFSYDPKRLTVHTSFQVADGVAVYGENGRIFGTGTVGYELISPARFEEVPDWIKARFNEPIGTFSAGAIVRGVLIDADANTYERTLAVLAKVANDRADDYEKWIEVGKLLYGVFGGSQTGFQTWDMWSRLSKRYESGVCPKKWGTQETVFNGIPEEAYQTLLAMAEQDSQGIFVKPAPSKAKPSDYMEAVHALGYRFRTNDMNDRLYSNLGIMSDGLQALIMTRLREYGYASKQVFTDAILAEGEENRFHPIKDYLQKLQWDGQDHIGRVASYFQDKDEIFGTLLRKWLIGAVSKVLHPDPTQQNPTLVLAGNQGLGKSVFVHWLGSSLPEYFISSAIYPENKDFLINSASHFVWEVKELGSTIRKSDMEALKAFLDSPYISFRAVYGRHEIKKTVTASYIGTINPDGNGFLNDPTGHRRFRVCQLTKIDFGYESVDINQVWAQAVAAYLHGETYLLESEDSKKVVEINERYVVDDPIADHITRHFDISAHETEWFTATSEIMHVLKSEGVTSSEIERAIQMRVSAVLTKFGCEQKTQRIAGNRARGWTGIKINEKNKTMYRDFKEI